jgi:ABC-type multidrug transport system fused ATPase/permease subunit
MANESTESPADTDAVGSLKNINLEIKRGTLCAIVGPVGAGKSSLLQSILGEMTKKAGTVRVGGRIAYAPQQGWLQNTTVKNNVIFGHDFDEKRYNSVLYACGLERDIASFPDGDLTEVGFPKLEYIYVAVH